MPSRIYALAKELHIENKELLEICSKVGITGKGSALANLDDDEIAKVRAYLSGGSKPAAPKPAAPTRVDPSKPSSSKPLFLKTSPPKRPFGKPEETSDQPPAVEKPTPAAKPEKPSPSESVAPLASKLGGSHGSPPVSPGAPAPSRDDSFARKRSIKVITGSKPGDRKPKDDTSKPRKHGGVVVKLADMPEAKQPPPQAASNEPKAQKPELRLPADAAKKAREGNATPLAQHIDKTEKKRTAEAERKLKGESAPLGKRGKRSRGKELEGEDAALGMANLRAKRTQERKRRPRNRDDDDATTPVRRAFRRSRRGPKVDTSAPRKDAVALQLPCTVRTFSEAAGVPAAKVAFMLTNMTNDPTNINSPIADDMVEMLIDELGVELEVRPAESLEDTMLADFDREEDPQSLQPRPPVVTFLGHVDHGKTSLLDSIIGTEVVKGEAGGITQHIRAYIIDKDGRRVSFVDTPGHEAFTEMRARGANVTDIAVLVIAADDGVMPQTEEAISHAKAAGVPIVVALNKIDLPGVDPNKALQGLTQHGLVPSAWGGDVEVVETSAITGQGVGDLLETLLTIAELHELKANPDRPAAGTCLESEQEPGRGVIAKLIVQKGQLNVGDIIVCGAAHGRVKAMYDTLRPHVKVESAGPSVPVNVTGLDVAPGAGDSFFVLDEIGKAREIAASREQRGRTQRVGGRTTKVSFIDFMHQVEEGTLGRPDEVITLNLIIRADVRGSIEAIEKELSKLEHPEVKVKILQASVGGISVADVTLADASQAVVVGFNVIPDEAAQNLAEERGVEIRRYDVIYKIADDVKATLEGKLKPEKKVVEMGRAIVRQVFSIGKNNVAGCYVQQGGSIERNCRIRVFRENRLIGEYAIDSLRRGKDDAKEVSGGLECGIRLANFNDVKQNDLLEAYKIEEVARSL